MKVLFAFLLVLVLPLVLAAPVATESGAVAVPVTSTGANENKIKGTIGSPADSFSEGSERKAEYRHGDTVYPSKEAMIQAIRSKNAQPLDGQYAYPGYGASAYDYYGTYPQYGYPYSAYDAYAVDPYAASYAYDYTYSAAAQEAAREQAAYEQALKDWQYKKYLYDNNQTHLRPDLFPEIYQKQHQQQQPEQQVQKEEKEAVKTTVAEKKLAAMSGHHEKPKKQQQHHSPEQKQHHYHEQPQQQIERAQRQEDYSGHAYPSPQPLPHTTYEHIFQAQPEHKVEQAHNKKYHHQATPAFKLEEFPEAYNSPNSHYQNTKQAQARPQNEPNYYPAEQSYYPKTADKVVPLPPIRAERIEAEVYGEVPTPAQYHHYQHQPVSYGHPQEQEAQVIEQPQAHPQQNYNYQPQQPVHHYQQPSKQHQQYQAPQSQQYQQPHHKSNKQAYSAPAQHPQTYHQPQQQTQAQAPRLQQSQSAPASAADYQNPGSHNNARHNQVAASENTNKPTYEIFNRDTMGKRILGRQGLLEDADAEWDENKQTIVAAGTDTETVAKVETVLAVEQGSPVSSTANRTLLSLD
ncbi:hypothetical protein BDZ91DRAFT_758384 [Kalaharituber pfeilii]|nr:hypothetical protein BDZ91DRAFT_758384 [Kalaharituber pfeilii]